MILSKISKLGLIITIMIMVVLSTSSVPVFANEANNSAVTVLQNLKHTDGTVFPIGNPNTTYAKFFDGQSYVKALSNGKVPIFNVTFAKGAHIYWHVHHNTEQVLIAISGKGYYQIWGQPTKLLLPGDTVTIPAGVKHWHGAAPDSPFQHIAIMEPVKNASTEWLEPVNKTAYNALK